jgi:hypothetical protein
LPVPRDPGLRARIVRRSSLVYRAGADAASDRPAHVRAASALVWIEGRLAIVQDDANFIALVNADTTGSAKADHIILPEGPDGRRQFDDLRGNKAAKLDLESCITVVDGAVTTLVAFGSGSTAARERILTVTFRGADAPEVRLIPAPELYAALRAARDFAGTELNIEGAMLRSPSKLHLFGRGNGAARDGRQPVNATCRLDWPQLWKHLHDPSATAPRPNDIRRFDLGDIDGIPLSFTDAIAWGRETLFSAAAEASPDAIRDGHVVGSALGIMRDDGAARCTVLLREDGDPFIGKIEGLAEGTDPHTVFAVADADDPGTPSELCVIALEGRW